jgi:F-type H+-transporting ATPase subunit gamma
MAWIPLFDVLSQLPSPSTVRPHFPPVKSPAMAFVTSVPAGSFASRSSLTTVCARSSTPATPARAAPTMGAGQLREVRDRIGSVKNTEKITDAMRLVSAAKVRRAQDAVLRTRPFSETLQKVLGGLIGRLESDFSDLPLLQVREAKNVVIVVITGDRGLCGSYNTYSIKKTEARIRALQATGATVSLVTIGKKGNTYFKRRATPIKRNFLCGQAPTAAEATEICDELLAEYLSGEVDRIELIYTKFVSLIASSASVRTLLPLSPTGLEAEGDEVFQLTSKDGNFTLSKEAVPVAQAEEFPSDMIFEQEPLQILNAILPLYLNGQLLRTLQESVASELAARMQSMQSATDNARSLRNDLSLFYNRGRQAAITQEIAEVCGSQL